jgi:TrmH family RNA methyltransferase
MLSKNIEKLFRKLQSKKYRWQYQMFVAEGPKVIREILREGLKPVHLFSDRNEWVASDEGNLVSSKELKAISRLEATNEVVAIFPFPELERPITSKVVVVLDQIIDPGNLGTILRTCDWFGIQQVYCTVGSTDVFNAKCIQSTMGSIARVNVEYAENETLAEALEDMELLVADMDGQNILSYEKPKNNVALVFGSESHGPSLFWKERANKVTIPRHQNSKVESLNVAQAASIILSQLSL